MEYSNYRRERNEQRSVINVYMIVKMLIRRECTVITLVSIPLSVGEVLVSSISLTQA
jgi:hypothetical protein